MALIDEPRRERLRGQLRAPHRQVAVGASLQLAHRVGLELALDPGPRADGLERPRVDDLSVGLPELGEVADRRRRVGEHVGRVPHRQHLVHAAPEQLGPDRAHDLVDEPRAPARRARTTRTSLRRRRRSRRGTRSLRRSARPRHLHEPRQPVAAALARHRLEAARQLQRRRIGRPCRAGRSGRSRRRSSRARPPAARPRRVTRTFACTLPGSVAGPHAQHLHAQPAPAGARREVQQRARRARR